MRRMVTAFSQSFTGQAVRQTALHQTSSSMRLLLFDSISWLCPNMIFFFSVLRYF